MSGTTVHELREKGLTTDTAVKSAILLFGLALSLWIIYSAYFDPVVVDRQANIVLGVGLAIYYLVQIRNRLESGVSSARDRAAIGFFLLLIVAVLLASLYINIHLDRWLRQGGLLQYNDTDLLVGAVVIAIVTDATFREFGKSLGGIIVIGIVYALIGGQLPGILGHSGMSFERLIFRMTISLEGIFGIILQIGATWIAIFLVLAGIIEGHRGFDYILEIGKSMADKSRSGVAQSAVVSSMFIGSMMGGAAANVATTGSFTIPLMKDNELPSRFAGAVESLASTGGQVMPPIMSIAAFLMADFTGIPYADVAIAGVIPVLLYYIVVAMSVHFKIVERDWGMEDAEIELEFGSSSKRDFYIRSAVYATPLVILIYFLMILRYPIMLTGFYSIVGFLVVRFGYDLYNGEAGSYLLRTVEGLELGAVKLAQLLGILASLGIIIDVITFSGLANRIAILIILSAGESIVLVLLLVMIVSIAFGLGMPTPAAYVVVALILAPSLVEIGLSVLAAHFFVFYFAVFSNITPPVAVAVAVAAGIADADFLETSKMTLILGGPTYLIPFVFVMNPELLAWEFPLTFFKAGIFFVMMYALVMFVVGFNGARRLTWIERAFTAVLAITIAFVPDVRIQFGLLAIFLLYVFSQRIINLYRKTAGTV